MSAQLFAPPPAVQPRGIHLVFRLGFYASVQQLECSFPFWLPVVSRLMSRGAAADLCFRA